ncbi:MAG: DUF4846 domain-containing protein, partial [Ferruginibacter sp.]
MHSKTIAAFLLLSSFSCKNSHSQSEMPLLPAHTTINEPTYKSIVDIPVPRGFKRVNYPTNSFAYWLEQVSLKKDKTVYLFDGRKKQNQSAQFAVLDIPIGNKDLQQCADAVMRLRALYLFDNKNFDSITFYDNEKKAYHFTAPYSNSHFNDYLQRVFGMCGTASLAKQLHKISYTDIKPGDVLIRGGFPGHAVIVIDMAENEKGEKKYMLAQSYMPAQDIHVLINPANATTAWYDLNEEHIIETPDYRFYNDEW